MSRADNVATAQALRAEGLLLREIAQRLDAPLSTVAGWLADPTLAKQRARRRRYAGQCMDCGKPTERTRCSACSVERQQETKIWTPDHIVARLRALDAELGRAPTVIEARNADAPVQPTAARREFGSWNAAIVAAGLTPRGRGQRLRGRAV